MRIISGTHKGKRLSAPKKLPVRPTTDFAKEALFNILNNYYHFSDVSLLDLFAGIGSISFEFASRGSQEITAVDVNSGCIQYITKITEELNFPIDSIKSDVFKYLERTKIKTDLVFADPPYNFEIDQFETIVELVFKNNLLEKDGFLIVEHSKHTDLSHLPQFSFFKRYGGSVFSFFEG